jgi:hypothetical protein
MSKGKWSPFIAGFVLGLLVGAALLGGFGWQKYREARADAAEARLRLETVEEELDFTNSLLVTPDHEEI